MPKTYALMLLAAASASAMADGVPLQAIEPRLVELTAGPERLHIRNQAQWQAFWARYAPGRPAPHIDFKQYDLLVAFMGTQPSGGYSVHIGPVEMTAQGARVRLLQCRPPANAAQLTEITAPHDNRLVPKLLAPPHWNIVDAVTGKGDCR
ncbi:protease complex subunit PrcB family protein [Pseudoduganella namucuonensis]|uniref:PrcB C-terminal domain-containing protein n=1 Tax=Pseudoduganella namucuonensis TaxID=1035707 RepID=A0A1I7HA17_9BURK|nr:protease complex subunit PrcB family protein [Pseudoduganella namucuonensis]SFU57439.1 hypothetical protein SAMN05216552_100593 [Pseudoduganella namucuonensis]